MHNCRLYVSGVLMKKHIANIVTGCRILGSAVLLFFPVFSAEFYAIYIICGFSDMIDGTIARKTNSTSKFGSELDTVADITFFVMSLIKILPTIHIPLWLWIWDAIIAIIKIGNIIWGCISEKRFISLHTVMNKVTGFLLFLLPLTISLVDLQYSLIVVCCSATFSAIQEGLYIIKNSKNR